MLRQKVKHLPTLPGMIPILGKESDWNNNNGDEKTI